MLAFISMIFGFLIAAIIHHLLQTEKVKNEQKRNALIAEYMDKQLWQFISLDEWLKTSPTKEK